MTEEILKRVDALAMKLGVTAQYLWGVLVKQARVEMWESVIGAVFFLGLVGVGLWGIRKIYKTADKWDRSTFITLVAVATGVCFAIALLIASHALECAMNPEYFALQKVLSVMGK